MVSSCFSELILKLLDGNGCDIHPRSRYTNMPIRNFAMSINTVLLSAIRNMMPRLAAKFLPKRTQLQAMLISNSNRLFYFARHEHQSRCGGTPPARQHDSSHD